MHKVIKLTLSGRLDLQRGEDFILVVKTEKILVETISNKQADIRDTHGTVSQRYQILTSYHILFRIIF